MRLSTLRTARTARAARTALPASLVALSLVLAGCGGDDSKKPEADKSSQAPAPDEPSTWPLTGVEAKDGQSVSLDRPVIVTKIDNSTASSPQIG